MRVFYIVIGCICVSLGVVGIPVPVLPTTPFLLLAAFCFLKSSPKLHKWLLNNKVLGSYINDYMVHKRIPLKSKIITLAMLWIGISISAFGFDTELWLKLLLYAIAIGVSIHILSFKS